MTGSTTTPLHKPAWLTITCHRAQRVLFRDGTLVTAWAKAYPMLFDEKDRSIALRQPLYHFWEWVTAIYLYHAYGYHSLVEQYQFKLHERKLRDLRRLPMTDGVRKLLVRKDGVPQGPDLLVFRPDYEEWFFCEVKGPGDKVRPAQEEFFKQLKAASQPVRVVTGVFRDWKPS